MAGAEFSRWRGRQARGKDVEASEKRERKQRRRKEKKKKEIVRNKSHLANARGAEETEAEAAATREDDANIIWLAIVWGSEGVTRRERIETRSGRRETQVGGNDKREK